MKYVVTLDRLGRRSGPIDPFIVETSDRSRDWDEAEIEDAVFKIARKRLVSRGIDVDVALRADDRGVVRVFAGFHTVGEGTVRSLAEATAQAEKEEPFA